jgi:SAM-dependent methyltransferase
MTKVLNMASGKDWTLYHGDNIEVIKGIPDNSLHYSIFSPPFSSLYTYSNSERDMGNCKNDDEFFNHFMFLIKELYRVIKPGRLVSFHCMNLPSSLQHHGYIGLRDFRGDLIRAFRSEEWIFHSEVVIWKDPIIAMQRTKAIGLLHKQVMKDSAMSRQGIPDYLVTMRKPGKNPDPVEGCFEYYTGDNPPVRSGDKYRDSINIWQNYASPVWMDINPSDTLQRESARDNGDERHISLLQLQVIERCLQLWTNKDDCVLDPFSGIGSTGAVCARTGRKYVGIELKESYYKASVNNLIAAEPMQQTLFDLEAIGV